MHYQSGPDSQTHRDNLGDSPLTNELRLRHLTLDEALPKLEKYLHEAYMSGLYKVTIIHGRGTGMLRENIRRELARHPLVRSYRPGGYTEGGEGVTVVELSEK
jgi:DNA mismatch repair protein MutS2